MMAQTDISDASGVPPVRPSGLRPYLPLLVAVALSILVYLPTLSFEFIYDDLPLIVEKQLIRSLDNLPQMLTAEDTTDEDSTGYYRPVILVVDALVYAVASARPLPFHLMNILYHALSVGLLFLLARRITGSVAGAFFSAAFFGLHPLTTESVAFVSAKNNIICAIFILGSVLSFLRYQQAGRLRWLAVACGLLLLGSFSKEFALMTPFVLFAFYLVADRTKTAISWRIALPWLALAVPVLLYLIARSLVLKSSAGLGLASGNLVDRILMVPGIVASYLRLMVLPIEQRALYDIRPGGSMLMVAGSALLLITALYAVWRWRRIPWIWFGSLWFCLYLAPVSNIIPIGGSAMAERYLYIPLMGGSIIIGGACSALIQHFGGRRSLVIAAMTALAVLASLTVVRSQVWRNDETLYRHMTEAAPLAYKGWYNLGNTFYKQGKLEEASRAWERCIEVKPTMFAVHNNLGVVLERLGRYEEAEGHYRAVLSFRAMPEVYGNIGNTLKKQKRLDEAQEMYRKAINMNRRDPKMYLALSELYEARGDVMGALQALDEGVDNQALDAHVLLLRAGAILGEHGMFREARDVLQRALTLQPDCAQCSFNLNQVQQALARIGSTKQ